MTNHKNKLSPPDAVLVAAIREADFEGIRRAIAGGANPNGSEGGVSFLEDVFWDQPHDTCLALLRLLAELGAKPGEVSDVQGLLYTASLRKNAEEMRFLLDHGMNPNARALDEDSTLYDSADNDYFYDVLDNYPPLECTGPDSPGQDAWLDFLDRCADALGVIHPDHLRVLRRYGGLTSDERDERRAACQRAGILQKILSGGQTGADRAALDWAVNEAIPHGGWCPAGRRTEDGAIPARYSLNETEGTGYRQRTRCNVLDSDATLIVNLGELDGGTLATWRFAEKHGRPCLLIQSNPSHRLDQAAQLNDWLHEWQVQTLNVAGPRESKRPGIYRATYNLLSALLGPRRLNTG